MVNTYMQSDVVRDTKAALNSDEDTTASTFVQMRDYLILAIAFENACRPGEFNVFPVQQLSIIT